MSENEIEQNNQDACNDCNGTGEKTDSWFNPAYIAIFGFSIAGYRQIQCSKCKGTGKIIATN